MSTNTRYKFLEQGVRELEVEGTGIRASALWHDRYVSRLRPSEIAEDRDIPVQAVYEALTYCRENWEAICKERDAERGQLEWAGFFNPPSVANG
jgi:hypothetical protein